MVHVDEHGRLVEVAGAFDRASSQDHAGALRLGALNMTVDLLELERRDQRADHRLRFIAGSHAPRFHNHRLDEFIVDRVGHIGPLH